MVASMLDIHFDEVEMVFVSKLMDDCVLALIEELQQVYVGVGE